ncbi:efflux RND transporter permease subunit [Piscirickettsia litoralis]|uniref:efflux RND transporter permease subunit n=1 Tax=Piscirickettsia litoralis TaxID=1891921 RepID=UPI0009809027|nr:efflux RND transporter permease subunit [Piscirickettsia litoralis]
MSAGRGFLELFVKHRVLGNVLMLMMLGSGLWGIWKLNAQFLPHFEMNYVSVTVPWAKANATDIEESVIVPLERELRSVSSIKKMNSVAYKGVGVVILEFKEGTDMGRAVEQVKNQVAQVQGLPQQAEAAKVKRIEHFEPVARLLITGPDNLAALRKLAHQFENQLLARGIDKISLVGVPDQEVAITISSRNLTKLQMTHEEVGKIIAEENARAASGSAGLNEVSRELRVTRQAKKN